MKFNKSLALATFICVFLFNSDNLSAGDEGNVGFNKILSDINIMLDAKENQNFDSILIMNQQAYTLAIELGIDSLVHRVNYSFAKIYLESGNYLLALDYFFKVLEYIDQIPLASMHKQQFREKYFILINTGYCYFELGMLDLAESYFQKTLDFIMTTLEMHPETFNEQHQTTALFNLGAALLKKQELEKAKEIFDRIDLIAADFERSDIYVANLNNLGEYYKEKELYPEALLKYTEALQASIDADDLIYRPPVHNNIARILIQQGSEKEAIEHYIAAFELGIQVSDWLTVIFAADALSEIYAKSGDYHRAFDYGKQARVLTDSLFNPSRTDFFARYAYQYEFDKKLRISQIEQSVRLNEQRNQKRLFFLLSVTFFLLLVLAALLIMGLRNKVKFARILQENLAFKTREQDEENTRIKNELDAKNRYLTEKAMSLVQKNELASVISEKLMAISKTLPDEHQAQLYNIASDLITDPSKYFWKEFETRFSEVHHTFFQNLNDRFPDLTPAEKRLAVFLRLNLSTKEISLITFQNPDSIKVARSRLRKKLSLKTGNSLVSFLSEF